jgi:hydroxymethylglutaryl-CoA lyase
MGKYANAALALLTIETVTEERMDDVVKIVECPRDAWQGLPAQIPPEVKADYLRKLADAGFTHIDAVSFVSPSAVPQMADSEQVLALLRSPEQVEIIAIVVNEKGAERAIKTGAVRTLGFPYSTSLEFLRRNQHQTPQQALHVLGAVAMLARDAGLDVVAYLSMAFGNPYGDAWSAGEVARACGLLIDSGVRQISLADTVGLATPDQIAEIVAAVLGRYRDIEIGVHLHARRSQAAARIRAAFEAGCRRFDAAIGGLGGCPFAQDALVGNIPTEILMAALAECGARLPSLGPLENMLLANAEIASRFGALAK